MFRILEILGLLAPLLGVIVLIIYRHRASQPAMWGIAGALAGAVASFVGFVSPRLTLLVDGEASGGGIVERLEVWSWIRTGLLILGVILLLIGVFSGRAGHHAPYWWVGLGVAAVLVGFVVGLIHIDFGPEHDGLTEVVSFLVEIVHFALMGIGLFVLCIGVVSRREPVDGRRDPEALLRSGAGKARRLYDRYYAEHRR